MIIKTFLGFSILSVILLFVCSCDSKDSEKKFYDNTYEEFKHYYESGNDILLSRHILRNQFFCSPDKKYIHVRNDYEVIDSLKEILLCGDVIIKHDLYDDRPENLAKYAFVDNTSGVMCFAILDTESISKIKEVKWNGSVKRYFLTDSFFSIVVVEADSPMGKAALKAFLKLKK